MSEFLDEYQTEIVCSKTRSLYLSESIANYQLIKKFFWRDSVNIVEPNYKMS